MNRLYRNILRIIDHDQQKGVVYVVIPSWEPNIPVPLPLALIHEWLPGFEPKIGTRLIAKVNTGAGKPEDLHFTDFEIAP